MLSGLRWVARVSGAGMVLAMALAASFTWRLAQGPIVIPGLGPRLGRALGDQGATGVDIGSVQLAWDAREREIDLLARDVRLARQGMPVLELPAASLQFALWPLLKGQLVLRGVELPEPRLTVERGPDGTLRIDDAGAPDDGASVSTLLVSLAHPSAVGPLAELRRVEVSGGVVAMEASTDQPALMLRDVSVLLVREGGMVRVDAGAACAVAGRTLPLSVAGTIEAGSPDDMGTPAVAVNVTAGTPLVPRDGLAMFWPPSLDAEVRAWVLDHVRAGRARDLEMTLRGHLEAGAPATLEAVDLGFDFEGMTLALGELLPVVAGMRGRARGSRDQWRFEVARAEVGGLEVVRGRVEIDGPRARVGTTLRGSLADTAALLRRVGAGTGLPTSGLAGRIDATIAFDAPLGKPVDLARTAAVNGRLHDVAWDKVLGDRSLTAGAFVLEVARGGARLEGSARLADVPVEVVASRSLVAATSTLEATVRPDARQRAALGLDLRPWLDGTTPTRVERRGDAIALRADLRDAVVAVPALGMAKAAGVPGSAEARVVLRGGQVAAVDGVRLDYGATRLAAQGRFDATGALAAGTLDGILGPVPGRAAPARITLRVSPGTSGRAVTAESDDVDLLFRAMGTDGDATGGSLTFAGTLGPGPGGTLDGTAEARDFRVARAPVLARVLAMTSVPGMTTVFTGRGLAVTRLASRVAYRAGRITLTDGTIESPSLGMRFAGTIDTTAGTLDLRGAVVPSYYGFNALGGRVPVLGRVLTGARKEGLQVFEFSIRGPTAAPRIAVDPVSSLAPGVLRDLLRLLPGAQKPAR